MEDKVYEAIKKIAVVALSLIDPLKALGTELFEALARVTVGVPIEAVSLRTTKTGVEVYLTLRGPKEAYANLWHSPGTFLRPKERVLDAFARLEKREGVGEFISHEFVGVINSPQEERGHVVQHVYCCALMSPTENEKAKWFPVDNLPENIVPNHRDYLIHMALGKKGHDLEADY